jgi:putative inorganic carbon (HCO3(-)) transporter
VTGAAPFPQQPSTITGETGVDLRDPAVLLSLLVPTLIGLYLLITSTVYLVHGVWPYDIKRILQLGLLLVLFLVPALNGRIRREFGALLTAVPSWLMFTLLAIFFWGVLSALINSLSVMHALNSLSEVALLSTLVLGVFVVAACRRTAGTWFDRIAIAMIALTGLAVGLQELIGVVAAQNAGVDFNFRISLLHFSWPRFYNQVQSWAIPALVALPLLFARYRLAAILCFIVLGLQWYIILMTGARGSFVAIGAASVFALIFLPPVRSCLLKWQIAGFVLGALVFAAVLFSFETSDAASATGPGSESIHHSMGREADRKASGSRLTGGKSGFFKQSLGRPMAHTSGRMWMWSVTVRDARDNPLLGIGPMNYVCTSKERIGHPHNFPLQLAAEWGIPVALAVCVIFFFLLWRISRSIRQEAFGSPEDSVIAGLLLTGVMAAALHACLSGVMVMPASQVTGLLMCGMLLGLYPPVPGRRTVPALRWGFIPGLLLAVGLLGLGAHELQTMKSRSELLEPWATMWPRIWQDAKVCRLYSVQNEVKN